MRAEGAGFDAPHDRLDQIRRLEPEAERVDDIQIMEGQRLLQTPLQAALRGHVNLRELRHQRDECTLRLRIVQAFRSRRVSPNTQMRPLRNTSNAATW